MNKLRVKHGENEIEIEGTDNFIKAQLVEFYSKIKDMATHQNPSMIKHEILDNQVKPPREKDLTPAEYFLKKGPKDGISQILVLGKYLEDYRSKPEFTPEEVNNLGREARLSKKIHSQYFTNAVKQGLLRGLGNGKYTLTLSAEPVIANM